MKKTILYWLLFIAIGSNAQTPNTGSFFPEAGKQYIVSAWVKEDHPTQKKVYTSTVKIQFLQDATIAETQEILPSGEIIDGWQRIIGIITIPQLDDPSISIELNCKALGDVNCYYDDVRFFPYNGNLKSFVYDEETKKLMAELDENNYATYYEYDLEGGLVRVKKETERGVFTIQETRSGNSQKQVD
ncbi:MAG: hypothetical protein V4670_06270 [Bacteroidota bacterium]